MKAKSLKKLEVIKEICSWLQTFRPSNQGSQEQQPRSSRGAMACTPHF